MNVFEKKNLINEMINSCVHLGHKKKFLNDDMIKYVLNNNSEISIINLEKTFLLIKEIIIIIKEIIENNKIILFICNKKNLKKITKMFGEYLNMPYVNKRWLGGTLTNFRTLKRNIVKINYLLTLIKMRDIIKIKKKKVIYYAKKFNKLRKYIIGIIKIKNLPDLLFVIDVRKNKNAIKEANKLKIPVIALVDTNNYIKNIDFPIPGNDDSYKSIKFFLEKLIYLIINFRIKKFYSLIKKIKIIK